jgi:hypothetical protein
MGLGRVPGWSQQTGLIVHVVLRGFFREIDRVTRLSVLADFLEPPVLSDKIEGHSEDGDGVEDSRQSPNGLCAAGFD